MKPKRIDASIVAAVFLLPLIAHTFVPALDVRRGLASLSGSVVSASSDPHFLSPFGEEENRNSNNEHRDNENNSNNENKRQPLDKDDATACNAVVSDDEDAAAVNRALLQLDKLVQDMKPKNKECWVEATKKCPELIGQDHKLLFLRAEEFDVERAAQKLVKYWDARAKLFGTDRAYLPLTLDGALRDDYEALKRGVWRIAGKDADGRTIVFADPSRHDARVCSIESVARANWYVIHAALEDEEAQRRGVVFINYPKNVRLSQLNPRLAKMSLGSECLPVQIKAFHIVNPPRLFTTIVFPIIRAIMGQRYRDMLVVHSSEDDEKILQELEAYGMPRRAIPSDLPGGMVDIDHIGWIEQRRKIGC